jgi:hypothetical protein
VKDVNSLPESAVTSFIVRFVLQQIIIEESQDVIFQAPSTSG